MRCTHCRARESWDQPRSLVVPCSIHPTCGSSKWLCTQARSLLAPYLPPRSSSSPFSEGGALYALGLIHANHGKPIIPFLLESLNGTAHEVGLTVHAAPAVSRAC